MSRAQSGAGSFLAFLLAAGLAACSHAPDPASDAAASVASAQPRRVILISLDGAGNDVLRDLYRQGLLREGGFERFFRDGQVADGLVPVDPTLTSTSHISLATGFPPAATGIVANQFHPGGSPSSERANGFDAPIGTETLWEAARRQGRKAGVLAWPGADAKGERRTADWGLVYTNNAEQLPQVITLSRADWQAGSGSNISARVKVGNEKDGPTQTLELVAVDSTDDGQVNYDGVAVAGKPGPGGPLQVGKWGQVTWTLADGLASSRLKLLSLAPDLSSARLFVDGIFRTTAYGELAADLTRRGLAWPGPPDNAGLSAGWQGKPGIDVATWTEQAEHMAAFLGEALRTAAARPDWDLLMGYFPVIDMAGHRLLLLDERQAGFSPARRDELEGARRRVWQAVDAELRKLIAGLDLSRTTVVVVSDHGMMPVHTSVDPNALLAEAGLLAKKDAAHPATGTATGPAAYAIAEAGAAHVYVERGGASTLADLAARFAAWKIEGEAPIERVLTRQEAARMGIDHPNSGDLVLFAGEGYVFRQLPEGKSAAPAPVYGAHGHLSSRPEMRGIYLALGAGVDPRPGKTVRAIEVAPRVAAWLGIAPPQRQTGAEAR
jgi:predicted AlkP superfamily pyrophosphatase or phosphodiesterase